MTTIADKIRALKPEVIPTDACCLATFNLGWSGALASAAALVEAEPQAVLVKPLTAADLADALGCFWNAAIGDAHRQQDGLVLASIMAEGLAAVQTRLQEIAAIDLTPTPVDASPAPDPVSKERLEDDVSHSDDVAVNKFARAMKAKLAQARTKGRGGWDDPGQCSELYLAKLLVGHLGKGNPGTFEDVANFAMMLHQRGANPCVLKQAISVLPAPDPVSPTPTLDALAMRRAAIKCCQNEIDWCMKTVEYSTNFRLSAAEDMQEAIAALPLPADAALAEAMKLPEVVALIEAAQDAEYDLLQWLDCATELTAAGFNMDGTAPTVAKLTAALRQIGETK